MSFLMGAKETAIVTISGTFIAPVITTLSVLFSSICRVDERKAKIALKEYRILCLFLILIIIPSIWIISSYYIEGKYSYSKNALDYVKIISFSILGFSLFNINRYYLIRNEKSNKNIFGLWVVVVLNSILTGIFYVYFKVISIPIVYSIALSTVITSFFLMYITYQRDELANKKIAISNILYILKSSSGIAISVLFEIAMFSIAPIFLAAYGVDGLVVHQYFYVISTIAIIFSYGVSVNAIYFVSSQLTTGREYINNIYIITKEKFIYIFAFLSTIIFCGFVNSSVSIYKFSFIISLFCLFDAMQVIFAGILRGYGKDIYVSITYFIVYSLTMASMFFNKTLDLFNNPVFNLWSTFCLAMAINAFAFLSYGLIIQKNKFSLAKGEH
ncbi:hypothetical protein RCN26_00765 [Escherichia marmotae]|nr:hypothetical protein [Escherichia marmotae]